MNALSGVPVLRSRSLDDSPASPAEPSSCCPPPQALSPLALLPAVKRETAKFVKDVLEQSPKPVVSKCAPLLPACAKLAGAGESDVREAGQEALVAFAVRSGSMGVLDKVGRGGVGWRAG